MKKIIYSKFSNERREEFQIRTDIVMDDSVNERKVYKSAIYEGGKKHLLHISDAYKKLSETYIQKNIVFCESNLVDNMLESPYIAGETLQQMLETAVGNNDEKLIDDIILQYIEWMRTDGGNEPFYMTEKFEGVFGRVELPENLICARVSDIDLIFSNIIVADNKWNIIDYEWTFEFPIPKNFIIYRAMFLAYHQIKRCSSLELSRLLGMAGITEEEVKCYGEMEENFQKYVLNNCVPIRDMVYKLNNRVISMNKVINQLDINENDQLVDGEIVDIKYNIDRLEAHSGNLICCGWAYAEDARGTIYPAEIDVRKMDNSEVATVMNRNVRSDVARVLGLNEQKPLWGFNIMWSMEEREDYQLVFFRGVYDKKHMITEDYILRIEREYNRRYPSKKLMRRYCDMQTKLDDIYYLKKFGYKCLRNIKQQRLNPKNVPYAAWRVFQLPDQTEILRQKEEKFAKQPLISIVVPAYRTPEKFLREMIESVQKQTYGNWELCIADGSLNDSIKGILEEYAAKDSRVKYKLLDDNYGISENTNQALNMVTGDYVGLLDHDDILEVNTLYEVVKTINETNADVLYTDEDKVSLDLQLYFDPHFKPDYNPDYLKSCNYICHFFVASRNVVNKVGKFDSSCDGSQDYDFILRCIREAAKIYHVPKVLYHWRCHPNSTAMNPESKLYCYEAGKRAIELDLKARGIENAKVKIGKYYGMYEVTYPINVMPYLSIITTQEKNIHHLLQGLDYSNYEVIETGENEFSGNEIYEATKRARGEVILFLSSAEGAANDDWLKIMIGNILRNEVGIVGPKLLKTDGSVYSAGLVLGLKGTASGVFVNYPADSNGYFNRAITQQCIGAVAVNGLMIKKEMLKKCGEWDTGLNIAQAGLKLCLEVQRQGFNVVFTPMAQIIVNETSDSPHYIQIQNSDFEKKYGESINRDPYYNPNFDHDGEEFSLSYN